jgi:protoheme IX farnesyltransferase
MKTTVDFRGTVSITRSRLLDFVTLVKPELTFLSVLTALAGYYLAAAGQLKPGVFLWTFLGTALVGGGAGALNQFIERKHDGLMHRTRNRPLPSGRLSPTVVFVFGVTLSVTGIAALLAFTTVLAAFLAAGTLVTYLFLYTPLKRVTPLATLVGAIPGALPPLIGWGAARSTLDPAAFAMFSVLFLWQIPHFLSLAWIYRMDYERAGFRILSVVDPDGSLLALLVLAFAAALVPASILLAWSTNLSGAFAAGASLVGVAFFVPTIRFMMIRSTSSARIVFLVSLLYLPALMFLMLFG